MKITDPQEMKDYLDTMRLKPVKRTSSGYKTLDDLAGGLARGGVTLLGGRMAMGRTSLVLNMVSRIAQQKGKILIFSTAHDWREVTVRLLCIGMGLPPEKLFDGSVSAAERMSRYAALLQSYKSDIEILPYTNLSLDSIQYHCEQAENLQLVVIDSLEHICAPVDFSADPINWKVPREPMDKVLRCLKALAEQLEIPVIGTVNLHRSLELRKNKRPRLSDLQRIGVSAELADQVLFLYRDRYYDPFGSDKAEVIVAKNYFGTTGTVELEGNYGTGRFDETYLVHEDC